VLSDFAIPPNVNVSNFLTVKDNIMFNPIFGMLSSRAIQNITRHARLSLMVIELITFKIYEIAESSNTARELPLLIIFEQPNTLKLNSNKSCFYQEIFSS